MELAADLERRTGRDFYAGFLHTCFARINSPRQNERTGSLAALYEPAFNEEKIDTLFLHAVHSMSIIKHGPEPSGREENEKMIASRGRLKQKPKHPLAEQVGSRKDRMMGETLKEEIDALSKELGFLRFGVAKAERLSEEGEYLREYLSEGREGSMRWLADTAEVRIDPRHDGMLPSAESVLVFAYPYPRKGEALHYGPGRIARYAEGRDYHNVLKKKLRRIERHLHERGFEARHSVDSRPVYERAWARRAGIGFIGKNCCLIVPGYGSHLFLATVITSAALAPDAPLEGNFCGSCTACLDACPTGAFISDFRLDARRCISYLTIEERGPIADELEGKMGDWLFGCDACQDVCPYNRSERIPDVAGGPFAPLPAHDGRDLIGLFELDEETFRDGFAGSPLKRPRREGLVRNAAIVLRNRGDRRSLPILYKAREAEPSPLIREAAANAISAIEAREGKER